MFLTILQLKGEKILINLKSEIEKDNANIHVKNIISLEKNKNNNISSTIIFGNIIGSDLYCVAIAKLNNKNNKWELKSFYNFKDFSQAIRKFAEFKKNKTK